MGGSGSFLRSVRGLLYLLEPLVAFFAAAALVAAFPPQPAELPVRLMGLHAQDALGVMQQDGTFEALHGWFLGEGARATEEGVGTPVPGAVPARFNLEEDIGTLVRALNPGYGWQIEVSDRERSRKLGADPEGETVSASRGFVKDGRFFTIKLNIYFRHS